MTDAVQRWANLVRSTLATQGSAVPPSAILGLVEIESSGNPNAQSDLNPGYGRAQGLMQVLPGHFGVTPGADGEVTADEHAWMCEPARNLNVGTALYTQLYARTGRLDHAAAAYFGAYSWASMSPTGATDVTGTSGWAYIQRWESARAEYLSEDAIPGPETGVAWQWPLTGEITQYFAWNGATGHTGLDIAGPLDAEVAAVADGTVVSVRTFPHNSGSLDGWPSVPVHRDDPGWEWLLDTYGSMVIVNHGGEYSLYAHTAPWINRGQAVVAGQLVGKIDNTGKSSGPHLHLECRPAGSVGAPVDPLARITAEHEPPPPPPPPPDEPPVDEPPDTPPADPWALVATAMVELARAHALARQACGAREQELIDLVTVTNQAGAADAAELAQRWAVRTDNAEGVIEC